MPQPNDQAECEGTIGFSPPTPEPNPVAAPISLLPGDVFLTSNPQMLGKLINLVQLVWSKDNQSKYTHSGIILDSTGGMIEATWTTRRGNIFEEYHNKRILIARHDEMDNEAFARGWDAIKKHEGRWYPGYRLVFALIPPVAKFVNFGQAVCSEYTAKFLNNSVYCPDVWKGQTPDDIHDMVRNWKGWSIPYEGICP